MTKSRGIHDMHGGRHTRAYGVWCSMRARCNNPNNPAFGNYGGRGISVCESWGKFSNFIADMGEPEVGMTLEREDNDKGYSKDNCVWADRRTQSLNKRNNVLLTVDGETQPASVFAERTGIPYKTLHMRLRKGWSHENAVKTPIVRDRVGIKRGSVIHQSTAELIVYAGEQMTLKHASERAGLQYGTVCQRIRKGWSIENALAAPAHRGKRDKGAERGVKFRELELVS